MHHSLLNCSLKRHAAVINPASALPCCALHVAGGGHRSRPRQSCCKHEYQMWKPHTQSCGKVRELKAKASLGWELSSPTVPLVLSRVSRSGTKTGTRGLGGDPLHFYRSSSLPPPGEALCCVSGFWWWWLCVCWLFKNVLTRIVCHSHDCHDSK